MGTNYIAPIWRMPRNANKDKLSNYSINFDFGDWMELEVAADPLPIFTPQDKKFSISVWMKTADATPSANSYLFSTMSAGGATKMGLYLDTSGNVNWKVYSGSPQKTITSTATLSDNTWYHIVGTWDGSTINLYIDGTSAATPVAATDAYTPTSGNTFATLGAYRYQTSGTQKGGYYTGDLAQVSVWNSVALSESQIQYLYNLNNPMIPGDVNLPTPIAYYPLGDNSNPTATAGYPNIVSNADSVFDFAASNEEIVAPAPFPDGNQGDLTISAWVNQSSQSGIYRPILNTGLTTNVNSPQISMALRNVSGNRLYLFYNGGGGSNYIFAQNVMTENNKWYHCAFVRSGSTGKLYVDGQEVSTLNSADFSANPGVTTTDSNMTLGAWRYGNNGDGLNGELSNVCIWDKALTDGQGGEIEELYNNGMPLLELSELPQNNNLLGWYKLNQSAVLTPGTTAAPWAVSIATGTPDYSSGDDGAYVLNGEFRCRDTGAYDFSDSFYLTFRTITGAHNNITLTSTGGYKDTDGGIRLQYRIDGGSWVQFQEVDGSGTGAWTFTAPSSVNCNTSYELRAQMHGSAYSYSYISLYDMTISASSGTLLTETFGQANYTGAHGGSISSPPAVTISSDYWDIPDNRSAYPQSFEFDGVDNLITLNKPGDWDDAQVHCVSLWIKNEDPGIGYIINSRGGSSTAPGFSFIVDGTSSGYIFSNTVTSKIATGYQAALKIPNNGEWHHVLWTHQPITNILKAYINGVYKYTHTGSVGTDATPSIGALVGDSGGAPWKGKLSNIMAWEQIVLTDGNPSINDLALGQVAEVYNNGVPLESASVASSNLKVWYKLDNTANYIDSPQNLTFTPDYWSIDPANITPGTTEALNFSGGYQNLPGTYEGIEFNDTPFTDNKFIMSFWYNPTKATNDGSYIYHNYSGGIISIGFFTNSFNIYADPSTSGSHMMRYYLPATRTGWHHLVIYMNQGSGSTVDLNNTDNLRIYIDGSELSVGIVLGDVSASPVRTEANRLGWTNGGNFEGFQFSNLSLLVGDNAVLSAIPTLYNGGTPGDISSLNPTWWYKLNSSDVSFPTSTPPTTAENVFTVTDSSGNGNTTTGPFYYARSLTDPSQVPSIQTVNVVANQGISSDMTETNLIDANVSTVNGESDTLPGTALVQSDLTRKLPFSNYSIDYNGTDEKITLASSISTGNNYTVSFWLNPDNISSGNSYIFSDSTTSPYKGLALDQGSSTAGGFGNFYYYTGAVNIVNNTAISGDSWSHIAIAFDVTGQEIKFYVNGALDKRSTSVANIGTSINEFATRSAGNYFNGKLSNISIFNSLLTQEEVLDVYNNGVPTNLNTSFTPGPPNYWWPMDEDHTYFNGSVLVSRDAVGSNDGTGVNIVQENIVGNAPGSEANGIATNLTIADLKGDMKSSINNSYSINMADYADGVTNPANSGRSTNVP